METFRTRILASDKPFYDGDCESLSVPLPDGSLGILAHHSNMISALVPGVMRYRLPGKEEQKAAVSAGIIKVEAGKVLILADTIERPEEIDENRAKRAAAHAKEALLQKKSVQEYREAQAMLARAVSRLRVGNRKDRQ